jgi:hypothetical protein
MPVEISIRNVCGYKYGKICLKQKLDTTEFCLQRKTFSLEDLQLQAVVLKETYLKRRIPRSFAVPLQTSFNI